MRPARTAKNQPEPAYAEPARTEPANAELVYAGETAADAEELPINIEGEPRTTTKSAVVKEAARHAAQDRQDDDRPALREEAIRQILEEFLA